MAHLRFLLPLLALALAAPVAAAQDLNETETNATAPPPQDEAPAAALGADAPALLDSPSLVPLGESAGLMLVGALGVAAGILLARRA